MDDVGRYLKDFILIFLLLGASGIFSSFLNAFEFVNESELAKLGEEDGNLNAQKLVKIKSHPNRFKNYLVLCYVLFYSVALFISFNLFGSLFSGIADTKIFSPGISQAVIYIISFICAFMLCSVFGISLPAKLPYGREISFLLKCYPVMRIIFAVLKPFVAFINIIARFFAFILGIKKPQKEKNITEEEIRLILDAGNENGSIEKTERDMIDNIFEFDDRTVSDVMTHRTDLSSVPVSATLREVVDLSVETGFSRLPVYEENIDSIIGVIYVKDLLKLFGKTDFDAVTVKSFLRNVMYVPESTLCRTLFSEFKEKKIHMAVVVDEYGGTSGIVTMEDLIESIVGNIQDEYDQEEEDIRQIDENIYIAQGSVDIETVEKILNVEISDSEESETLSGFITNQLGFIPNKGESPAIEVNNCKFTVLEVDQRRIEAVRIEITPPVDNEENEE